MFYSFVFVNQFLEVGKCLQFVEFNIYPEIAPACFCGN